jgi:RNA polymerase sigma-70 factor (ECF subfamily)
VRAAQTGNHEAFLSLLEILQPRLAARARSFAHDPATADDLLQETYLRAYENLPALRDPKAVVSWMLTILDRAAQRLPQGNKEQPISEALEPSDDEAADALLELGIRAEAAEELQTALARLSAEDRETVMLRFGASMNAIEIADATKSTPGAVRMRLSRALARLRKLMGVTR